MKFADLIKKYVVKRDHEKVRRNGVDDFDLGPRWVFMGLGPIPEKLQDWQSVWGHVDPNAWTEIAACMCNGQIGSFEFNRWPDGKVHIIANARNYIGRWTAVLEDDVPQEISFIVKEHPACSESGTPPNAPTARPT